MKLYKEESIKKIKEISKNAKKYFSEKGNISELKSYGIAGNTFRAYKGFNIPSKTYKEWVDNILETDFLNNIKQINSKEKFYKFHADLKKNLEKFWVSKQKKKLEIYQVNKILDLFLKFISLTKEAEKLEIDKIVINYANVPLDKFTLFAVKDLFYGIVIGSNPSMGDINDEKTYLFIQDQIFYLMQDAGLPNLYFDYYWNINHPKQE